MTNNKYLLLSLGLFNLTVLSGTFLISSSVFADDTVVDNVTINVPVSCSMSGTGMTSHNANIVNGTYQADIGTTVLFQNTKKHPCSRVSFCDTPPKRFSWCPRWDLNPYGNFHSILSRTRIPIPPLGHSIIIPHQRIIC